MTPEIGFTQKSVDLKSPKIPKELLSNSKELEFQANQAALEDSKVFKEFNCRKSLQRQPAETASRNSLHRCQWKT